MITIQHMDAYWARISGLNESETALLSDLLSYMDPDAENDWRYKSGAWDGKVRLLDSNGNFPAGLVSRVKSKITLRSPFRANAVESEVNSAPKVDPAAITVPLRDYQREGVEALLARRCAIGEIATGGGKTRMAIAAAEALLRPNPKLKALFIVPTSDIRRQVVDTIEELLGRSWASELTESNDLDTEGRILVATSSLLQPPPSKRPTRDTKKKETKEAFAARKAKWEQLFIDRTTRWQMYKERIFSQVSMLIVDEAHHSGSDSYSKICAACTKAYWRFGWTGTAFREDGTDLLLEAATGPVSYAKTAKELVELGFLVQPNIYMIRTPIYRTSGDDFRDVYKYGIIEHTERNQLIRFVTQTCQEQRRQTLLLVKETTHGELLRELLGDVPLVTGKTGKKQRIQLIEDFRQKKIPLLMATTLADEGLDVPAIDALILCGGGASDIKNIQRAGRAMRLYPGKTNTLIFDFEDSHNKVLQRHALTRGFCLAELGYPVFSWEVPALV